MSQLVQKFENKNKINIKTHADPLKIQFKEQVIQFLQKVEKLKESTN